MAPYETSVIENDVQERLIKVLGSCLPEDGMDLILIDKNQLCWTSDSVAYDGLFEGTPILGDMISRINDGDEPALTRVGDAFVVGVPLLTPCCDYEYAMLVLSCVDDASLLQNWPFVECVLNQIQCIAGLLEMQDDSVSMSS
jgi:hypothetical protein